LPLGGIESCMETVCFNVLSEIVKCVRWTDLIPKGVPSIVLIASHGPCKGNIFICLTFANIDNKSIVRTWDCRTIRQSNCTYGSPLKHTNVKKITMNIVTQAKIRISAQKDMRSIDFNSYTYLHTEITSDCMQATATVALASVSCVWTSVVSAVSIVAAVGDSSVSGHQDCDTYDLNVSHIPYAT